LCFPPDFEVYAKGVFSFFYGLSSRNCKRYGGVGTSNIPPFVGPRKVLWQRVAWGILCQIVLDQECLPSPAFHALFFGLFGAAVIGGATTF